MAERLSNKNPCNDCKVDRQIGNPNRWECECDRCSKPYEWKNDCIKKLAEYEAAAEDGRLVVLPCKVGDTVYSVTLYNGICKHEIRKFITDGSNTYACSNCKFPITDFGIRAFLTREEAEKALEEMKKNE